MRLGTFERSSVNHGRTSPVALPLFFALDDAHAGSGGGLGPSRSIRRRISAHKTRGTATSANWNSKIQLGVLLAGELQRSEQRFFEALWLDPTDPSGLDGLGSILMLRRDLKAAEFFFLCAINQAECRGIRYDAAIRNLATVRRYLR